MCLRAGVTGQHADALARLEHEAGVDDPEQRLLVGTTATDRHSAAARVERRFAVVLKDDPLGVERLG